MDLGQAYSMFHVGAISGAIIAEKPTSDGSVWVVEFILERPLPPHLSRLLEVARGGTKIFKGIQAALNDVKTVGLENAIVRFANPGSFLANRFEYLYPWIRGLHANGFSDEMIFDAFQENPATRLERSDHEAATLARLLIQHALGRIDGKALEKYLPPVDVVDVRYLKTIDDGYLCEASCPDSKDNFRFLVGMDVPERHLRSVLSDQKAAMCKFVLVAAHRRNPQEYADQSNPGLVSVAACRLSKEDIAYLQTLDPRNENIV